MNKAVATQNNSNNAMALTIDETINVLRASLYPGAAVESVKMVISYCQASNLDPFQKPVHIVPMYAATGQKDGSGKDIKAMRDVVMPGIGLYRTQAARSGQYAGVSEPEFGDDVTENLSGSNVTYPKWCKVTVKRQMPNGAIVEFAAKEIWKENYATKGKDSTAPNAMWAKRPYGQIAKCAEAQALRKAFPEVGSQPTADEMEGKFEDYIDGSTGEVGNSIKKVEKQVLPSCTNEEFEKLVSDTVDADGVIVKMRWRSGIQSGKTTADNAINTISTRSLLTDEQINTIKSWEPINA